MAKRRKNLVREMRKLAKKGIFKNWYVVNQEMIEYLVSEGCMIIYPNQKVYDRKGSKRVIVSWEDPSYTGYDDKDNLATELYNKAIKRAPKYAKKREDLKLLNQLSECEKVI